MGLLIESFSGSSPPSKGQDLLKTAAFPTSAIHLPLQVVHDDGVRSFGSFVWYVYCSRWDPASGAFTYMWVIPILHRGPWSYLLHLGTTLLDNLCLCESMFGVSLLVPIFVLYLSICLRDALHFTLLSKRCQTVHSSWGPTQLAGRAAAGSPGFHFNTGDHYQTHLFRPAEIFQASLWRFKLSPLRNCWNASLMSTSFHRWKLWNGTAEIKG